MSRDMLSGVKHRAEAPSVLKVFGDPAAVTTRGVPQ